MPGVPMRRSAKRSAMYITENNAYAIRFRMKNLLCKHGPACYRRALQIEASEPHFDAAA